MKYLVVLVAITVVPLLIFGMAMIGARAYSAGSVTWIDVVGFALQVMLIVVVVFVGIAVWKSSSARKANGGDRSPTEE